MVDDQTKTKEIVLPEESVLVIKEILKRYNLIKTDKELEEKFLKATAPEGSDKILSEMPSVKIAEILREYQAGETRLEDFPKILKEDLKISQKDAEEITEELKQKILISEEPTLKVEEKPPPKKEGPDVYREPIE